MAAKEGYGFTVSGASFTAIGYLKEVQLPGIATSRIDTTWHKATSDMATGQPATLRRIPPVTLSVFMDTAQYIKLLNSALGCGKSQVWTFTDSESDTTVATGWIDSVEASSNAADGSDAVEATLTVEFTGTNVHTDV